MGCEQGEGAEGSTMMSSNRRIELGAIFCWAETSEVAEAWRVEREGLLPGDSSVMFRTGDIRLASCTHDTAIDRDKAGRREASVISL